MGTELAEVDERYRITIPKGVRATFKVARGQRFYLVPYGEDILMKPVPADLAEKLDRTMGEFQFDRHTRRRAEEWLLNRDNK